MNKITKPSLISCILYLLIISIFVPAFLICAYFLNFPIKNVEDKYRSIYTEHMESNSSIIENHFTYIQDAVNLLQDSTQLRKNLNALSTVDASTIQPSDLYYTSGLPISYQTKMSNYAISTISIYSQNKLAYYSKQNASTQEALLRCESINLIYDNPTRDGIYVFSPEMNGYVYWVGAFTDIYTGKSCGKIIVEIRPISTYTYVDKKVIPFSQDYQVDLSAYPGSQYYVYQNDGTIMFSSLSESIGNDIANALPSETVLGSNNIISSRNYDVYKKPLYHANLNVLLITPTDEIFEDLYDIKSRFFLFVLIVIAIVLLSSILASVYMFAPIRSAQAYCNASKDYPSLPPTYDARYKELQATKDVISQNLKTIEEMRDVIMKNHIKMKDTEIQLLQSQINPHFLFNMLDIIGWQAAQDNSQASEMIDYLGNLLRSNILLNNQEKVPIYEEINYIKNYLKLQQMRFEEKFSYTLDIDEDISEVYYIPKLSLQPIVENCIVHGFRGFDKTGKITIKIWEDMDDIICTISDNGVGFNAEGYFEQARPDAHSKNPKSNHIALYNIQNRIKMLYGTSYGIKIDSTIGKGTKIMVTFPIDENKKDTD